MTIQEHKSRVYYPYSGPGDYVFDFRVYEETDLIAQVLFNDGTATDLVLGTDYTVTLDNSADGGTIHSTYELPTGMSGQLYISRSMPAVQLTDYVNNLPFDVEILEKDLDYLTILIQDGLRDLHDGTVTTNWRGEWHANSEYQVRDTVSVPPDDNWYVCLVSHTSSANFEDDLNAGYWVLALDVGEVTYQADRATDAANAAAASEANAATSEANAATSETNAANSATLAQQAIEDGHSIAEGKSIRITNTGADPIVSTIDFAPNSPNWSDTLDWNDSEVAKAGLCDTIMRGTNPNGPGCTGYMFCLTFEYEQKDGTGNLTQLAIGYYNHKMYIRHRKAGAWTSWIEFTSSDNYTELNDLRYMRRDIAAQGGVGADTVNSTIDWNDPEVAVAGSSTHYLKGSNPNAPPQAASNTKLHSFCFEYGHKNGSTQSDIVQLAISEFGDLYIRSRKDGIWDTWAEVINSNYAGDWNIGATGKIHSNGVNIATIDANNTKVIYGDVEKITDSFGSLFRFYVKNGSLWPGIQIYLQSSGDNRVAITPMSDRGGYVGTSSRRYEAIYAYNGTILTCDERDKNIKEIGDTSWIYNLKPIAYTWKDESSGLRYGFGAQTTYETMPDKKADLVQKPEKDEEPWGMQMDQLIPLLLNEMKMLRKRIEKLEVRA